ncbi:Cell division protein ZapA [Candidatus Arcanobacter lacustris]|jgi:cell division protein ZapA (FtsZ GTPase activity inhibitor)|uniref:Cell division protein ZapA n=1 Tax=Candidatus Arcanibacter lacustris TaxID=1607817 RepID=A0A0F5MND5_9RICK|nr:Cell division protein ZapA [Candidatus Arcanobacter lacustris]
MAIVNVSIRNCSYQIACNDGEEENLKNLASSLSDRVDRLSMSYAKANDSLLLVIAALTIENDLEELKKKRHQLPLYDKKEQEKKTVAADNSVSEALDAISEYVENLARKINNL